MGNELNLWGWNAELQESFTRRAQPGWQPARVMQRSRDFYELITEDGMRSAKLSGKVQHEAATWGEVPVVGDWVYLLDEPGMTDAMIQGMLPRRSCFSRAPSISGGRKIRNGVVVGGSTVEQALAANVDHVFLVGGLDAEFNLGRMERYLTVAWSSGASPVILLNKVDLCADTAPAVNQLRGIAPDVPVHCISAASGMGMDSLRPYLASGRTLAFLGSSGVGKSTLINSLFGAQKQDTGATSLSNGKGQHTTTCASLFRHEDGYMLIDTPGLRELRLWCDETAVDEGYRDIMDWAEACKFRDCHHGSEPGCAVRKAMEQGLLTEERFARYLKLHQEAKTFQMRKHQKQMYLGSKQKRGHAGVSK